MSATPAPSHPTFDLPASLVWVQAAASAVVRLNSDSNPWPIKKRKKEQLWYRSDARCYQRAGLLETQSTPCCGTSWWDLPYLATALSICVYSSFVSLKPTYLIRFPSLIALFLPCAHCVCRSMRDLTAYTCKALQELDQADVYAPRIRHSHASGGVVSVLIRCVAPFLVFVLVILQFVGSTGCSM